MFIYSPLKRGIVLTGRVEPAHCFSLPLFLCGASLLDDALHGRRVLLKPTVTLPNANPMDRQQKRKSGLRRGPRAF